MKSKSRWSGYTVLISRHGTISLRRPSGRAIAWSRLGLTDLDAEAAEWLATYPGATLRDARRIAQRGLQK